MCRLGDSGQQQHLPAMHYGTACAALQDSVTAACSRWISDPAVRKRLTHNMRLPCAQVFVEDMDLDGADVEHAVRCC
jgi:hypothetical protein